MERITFDFNSIHSITEFYATFMRQFALREEFGANLDALWDVVTGGIPLPIEIVFINVSARQRRRFAALILLFEEAEEELDGQLSFNLITL